MMLVDNANVLVATTALLMLVQLLEQYNTSHNLLAEALLARRTSVGSACEVEAKISTYPCQCHRVTASCYKLNDAGVYSFFPRSGSNSVQSGLVNLPPLAPKSLSSNIPVDSKENYYQPSNKRVAAVVDGNNEVPTLTPLQDADGKRPRRQRDAAIIGGVCAAILVISIGVLVYICLMRLKRSIRQTSETVSSASPAVELERGGTPYNGTQYPFDTQGLRRLTISELEHATRNFSQSNAIGEGVFGTAYKGLLLDGSIVAIKRRIHNPVQFFSDKVKRIASVHYQHLVKLLGHSEDRHQQLLVYEYISNGNVGNFLYDSEGLPVGRLDMRQRLFIALGAAAGLQHLHSLLPPLLHMNFRTTNVLVCENFMAKVSDYGLSKLLMECRETGSTSAVDCFLDPELNLSKNFSEQSDVYSFGVFLLELTSGRRASDKSQSNSNNNNIVLKARSSSLGNFIDETIAERSIPAMKQLMDLALLCLDTSTKRPTMTRIVQEIEQIHAREIGYLHTEIGEEIGAVKLGSELFR